MQYGAVITGRHIFAKRNDGREFIGYIKNVRAMPMGTLVTVAVGDGYRNVYLENCSDWAVYENAEDLEAVII